MADTKKTLTNTAAEDPSVHLVDEIGMGSSQAIYASEARGQWEFVGSDVFPVDAPRPELEAMGFVFGDPVPGDPLFCYVTLPKTWSRRPTDHNMWSEIVDAAGRVRVMVFYKAAFYDRCAFARIVGI